MNIGDLVEHIHNLEQLARQLAEHENAFYDLPQPNTKEQRQVVENWRARNNDLRSQIDTIKNMVI